MPLLQESLQRKESTNANELSVYSGEIASPKEISSEVKKLKAAFPEISADYLAVLIDRLIDNQFTQERVRDAINQVIDTSSYQRPSIANIVSFDRNVKIHTYEEVLAKCCPAYPAFEYFTMILIDGRKKWIEK